MDEITQVQQAVLDTVNVEVEKLERRLLKYQPLKAELDRLLQVRRVLLSEKSMTGGKGGAGNAKVTQEEVITFLRDNQPCEPQEISAGLSVDGTIIRSHLNRHKGTSYERTTEGWVLIGE